MKRIYSERKFLIIGIIVSLLIHIGFFSFLYFSNIKSKKTKKEEKPIKISLVPYEKVAKEQKNKGKRKVLKKKIHKKKVIKKKKTIRKPVKKIIPKPKKTIKKKPPKKIKKAKPENVKKPIKKIEKPKKIPEIKKEKPLLEKPKQEIKKREPEKPVKPKEEVVKKPSPPVENQHPKKLVIPDLSKIQNKRIEKKETQKDKQVMDYLKYIKIEFEKNKFYPDRAKKLGIEGTVILKFTILPDGTIDKKSIQVVEADHPFLARGAVRIFEKIKKLKKPPPNGKKMTVEIPIQYILYEIY